MISGIKTASPELITLMEGIQNCDNVHHRRKKPHNYDALMKTVIILSSITDQRGAKNKHFPSGSLKFDGWDGVFLNHHFVQ